MRRGMSHGAAGSERNRAPAPALLSRQTPRGGNPGEAGSGIARGPHRGPREQQSTGETLSMGSSREAAGKGLGRLCRAGKHSQDGAAGAWPRQELHNGLFGHD